MAVSRVNSCVKLLLGVTLVIVAAGLGIVLVFNDFLKDPSVFKWKEMSFLITTHHSNQVLENRQLAVQLLLITHPSPIAPENSTVLNQARTNESSPSMALNHHFPESIEKKSLTIHPVAGPLPDLPWMESGLKVTTISVMSLPWVKDLQVFLNTMVDSTQPVVITASNYEFRSSLLNWLAHALIHLKNYSVKNILVLSMDKEMHSLLDAKNISSLFVPHEDLSRVRSNTRNTGILRVEIARLIVMRLLNYWGYDVINYDSDAFIFRNPQELFDMYPQSHVIGSESFMPKQLHAKWGVTLCMGAVLFRTSPETELLWRAFNEVQINDDQKKLNMALDDLKLTFDSKSTQPWQGTAPLIINNASCSLRVTVIPMKNICRGKACQTRVLPECYVWHQGAGDHSLNSMKERAIKAKVWLLRDDWADVSESSSLIGKDWLRALITED